MQKPLLTLVALAVAGLMSVVGLSGAYAQATPEASPAAGGQVAHPAHIHSGTCDTLGDVVFPLNDVTDAASQGGGGGATPMATPEMGGMGMMGNMSAIPVHTSVTTVEASVQDILAAEHAINVHESAENIGNYIACGNIGGTMVGGTTINFGLMELNGSGYMGIGSLYDNGDGTTTVYVYLFNTMGMMGGGMATPTSDMGTPEA